MGATNIFRLLILIIPLTWVVLRLLPADHSRSSHLRGITQSAEEYKSHEETDLFLRHESIFEAHYQSHYATSGQTYQHYRLAYKPGFRSREVLKGRLLVCGVTSGLSAPGSDSAHSGR